MSKYYEKWLKKIDAFDKGLPIREGQITTLLSAVRWYRKEKMSLEEFENLADLVAVEVRPLGWNITPEQSQKGVDWLRKHSKTLGAVAPIVDKFRCFKFDGFTIELRTAFSDIRINNVIRIYRVIDIRGNSFRYGPKPWQDGGNKKNLDIFDVEWVKPYK